ncbi:MAG: Cytosine/purine/uracil/thiamine/allantoin permease family protein [Labilithrix sp.]|nr:Cytosine/purine/uracil/thiamine/allantoin permease family protein [Labilithrix sp.]
MADEQLERPDGRVELAPGVVLGDPALFNEDLAPVAIAKRTWTTYTYAALWISMAHCIPTYMMASSLISAGMSWWQALFTILLGNTIVLAPILLNSHPGTKYGIPFPVFARAAYGVFGANVPAVMRAIVACGWFGINTWIGGQALQTFFKSLWAGWPAALGPMTTPGSSWAFGGHYPTEWVSFLLFWGLNILIVYRGMDIVRRFENLAAPFVLVMTAALVAWAIWRAHGLGAVMRDTGKFHTLAEFWPVFVPSVTAMIGFWSTLSLNMPDFTRFGRSQREQAIGQVVALPTTMTVFACMGIIITSASADIYGRPIWDPVELVGMFESRLLVAVSMFTVVVATLGVNIAANVVSPANDFANLAPGRISFKTGGLITGIVGAMMLPWKLIADPSGYVFKWLLGYSGGLGSIAGVLVADYWLVRKKRLRIADLYRRDGVYAYGVATGAASTTVPGEGGTTTLERTAYRGSGVNGAAIAATLVGCLLAWIGVVVKPLAFLYDYAWFVGAGGAALAYLVLMGPYRRRLEAQEAQVTSSTP